MPKVKKSRSPRAEPHAGALEKKPLASEIWPPADEPIRGRHLMEFRQRYSLNLNAMEAMFGIASREAWYKLVDKRNADKDLDKTTAILLRYYARHPDRIPYITDIIEVMKAIGMDGPDFALLLGRKEISGRGWTTGTQPLPVVRNLAREIIDSSDRMAAAEEVLELCRLETEARGESTAELPSVHGGKRRRVRRTRRHVEADSSMAEEI